MSEIIGRDIECGVSVEDTRGTSPSTVEKSIKKVTADILPQAEHAVDDTTQGILEDSEDRRVVQKWVEGDIEGVAHADMIGYFIYNLYGAVSSSNVSGSVYSHEFTLQQSTKHASLSFFLKDGSANQRVYNGGMISSFELNASPDDFVRFTASFVARDSNSDSSSFSYDTEYDFIGKDVTIKVADNEGDLSSADAMGAKDLTISYDPSVINDNFVFGAYTPKDLYNSGFGIEISVTKDFEGSTFEDLYRNDNSKYMQITIQGSQDIGDGNNPKIDIVLNKVKVTDWSRSGGADELVTEDVTFKALYNESDSEQSKLTLQNLTEEYDTAPTV